MTSVHKKRRTCPETGKTIQSKNYYLKHRFEGDSRPVEFSLGTSDQRVAQQLAIEYVKTEERKRSGLYVTERQRSDGAKGLQAFVDEYVQYLIDKGTQRDHYRKVNQRLTDGIADLGWSSLRSIEKREYQSWLRSRTDWSKKTQSHYQSIFKAFCNWLWEEDYLPENPLHNVRSIKGVAAAATPPAALTLDEVERFLVNLPAYRRDFYSFMILTGLRAIEVNRLHVRNLRIDEKNQYWIALNRSESKARRDEFLEVPQQLHPAIDRLTAGRCESAKLLSRGRPTRLTFRKDLERANIKKTRFDGSTITLHSLRKTFVTMVQGVSPSMATTQRLARHASSDLTEIRYTDRKALNLHEVLDRLPIILSTADSIDESCETAGLRLTGGDSDAA